MNDTVTPILNASGGMNGTNDFGMECPMSADFVNPSRTINKYKTFARQNLATDFKNRENLVDFLQKLDSDKKIQSLYNTLSFTEEFQGIEDQYYQLKNNFSFISLLESLLNRTEEYSKEFSEPIENKQVLRMLYTMIKSRLNDINDHKNVTTIVNLYEYLEEAEQKSKVFRDIDKDLIINARQNEFKEYLNEKIKSSIKFIKKRIMPEIDNVFVELNTQIVELIKEMVERQDKFINQTVDIDSDIIDAIPPLNISFVDNPPVDGVRNLFKFVNSLIGAFGKAGPIKMYERNIMIGNSSQNYEAGDQHGLLNMNDAESFFQYDDFFKIDKPNLFLHQLIDMEHELNQLLTGGLPIEEEKALENVRRKVIDIKLEVVEVIKTSIPVDSTEIDQKRQELQEFLENERPILSSQGFESLIGAALAISALDDVPTSFYDQISFDDVKKMINFPKTTARLKEEAKAFEQSVENIYDVILSRFEKIEKIVNGIRQNVTGESDVELSISRWFVQSAVKDIKAFFLKLSNETAVDQILKRSFEKLDESTAILVDTYNQIDLMVKAKYALKLTENMQYSTDGPLNNAIMNLKRSI